MKTAWIAGWVVYIDFIFGCWCSFGLAGGPVFV